MLAIESGMTQDEVNKCSLAASNALGSPESELQLKLLLGNEYLF